MARRSILNAYRRPTTAITRRLFTRPLIRVACGRGLIRARGVLSVNHVMKFKMKPAKLILAILLTTLALHTPVPSPGAQSRAEKFRIIETVLRRHMSHYSSAKGYKLYYIGVELGGRDVTRQCLRMFARSNPPVKEFDPSRYDPQQIKREGGIVLGIRGIERVNKSEVKVYSLTFVSGFGEGLNWIHELRKSGRSWIITDEANLNLG